MSMSAHGRPQCPVDITPMCSSLVFPTDKKTMDPYIGSRLHVHCPSSQDGPIGGHSSILGPRALRLRWTVRIVAEDIRPPARRRLLIFMSVQLWQLPSIPPNCYLQCLHIISSSASESETVFCNSSCHQFS